MAEDKKVRRKLAGALVAVIVLALGLCVTTFALLLPMVSVEDNHFQMGTVKINLNDGKPIIQAERFEPGITVQKTFFLQNESTIDTYCELCLENIQGDLADILDMTLAEGDQILYEGKPSGLTRDSALLIPGVLAVNQRRTFTVTFHYPETAGNQGQSKDLSFDVTAIAVQTKNNPDRLFS